MHTMSNSHASAIPRLYFTYNWKRIQKYVRRLRQRIFCAEQLGQHRKVRKLQRLMLKSQANLLLSIKRVTQINKGKRTAGMDGNKMLTPRQRQHLYEKMSKQSIYLHQPSPVRRIYIPKKNGKVRPLGIPTIQDRISQNVVKNALEPQWEAKFEADSYGFRPKRSVHDAYVRLFTLLRKGTSRKWIFEGDFASCFDTLSHEHILNTLQSFPGKKVIQRWLQAKIMNGLKSSLPEEGTPQGGILSPLLANIALHGIEDKVGVTRTGYNPSVLKKGSVACVRYADDFVIVCPTQESAMSMYKKLTPYLEERGLTLAVDKTKISSLESGFDFLGFNFKQYETNEGQKLLIKPSKESIKKAKRKLGDIFRKFRGRPVRELILRLNPVIRGIGQYWSLAVAKRVFSHLDDYVYKQNVKFIKHLHPNKSRIWGRDRYFKKEHTGMSKNNWLLTDPKSPQIQLIKMVWIPIVRHTKIKYKNSPDDPALKEYYAQRDRKEFDRFHILSKQKMAKKQNYICWLCNESLLTDENLEVNHKRPKILGGKNYYENLELMHASCHRLYHRWLERKGEGKKLPKIQEAFQRLTDREVGNWLKHQFQQDCSREKMA